MTAVKEKVETSVDRLSSGAGKTLLGIYSTDGVCRTVCRRAEREILRLAESGAQVDSQVIRYVNRLSDYFFVLARKLNVDAGVEDIVWRRKETKE